MPESKRSFPAVHVPYRTETDMAGQFYYIYHGAEIVGLMSCLPNADDLGFPSWGVTMFTNYKGGDGPKWTWDGDLEKPTLTPSIYRRGHWHGFLTDGEFRSC